MKLIEKKCPNCGGDLEFKATDSEVTCTYCQRSFIIEKDDNNIGDEAFNLVYSNFGQVAVVSKVIFSIVTLFIIGIAVFMFVSFSKTRSSFNNKTTNNGTNVNKPVNNKSDNKGKETLESLGFVTKYEEIPEKLINDLHESGVNALENVIGFYKEMFMPKIVTSWKYVGSYFLTSKEVNNRSNNILYDVYSIVYKIDKKNITYYGVVATNNYKKVDGNVVTLGNTIPEAPKNTIDTGKYAFGYISLNNVLNDLVSKKITEYNIEYIGKVSKIED